MVPARSPALSCRAGQTRQDALTVVESHLVREVVQVEPGDLRGVGARAEGAPRLPAEVDEDVGGLARVVGHPDRVEQVLDLDLEPRLLEDLPAGGVPGVLVDLLVACGEGPGAQVRLDPAADEEHPGAVLDRRGDGAGGVPEVHEPTPDTAGPVPALDGRWGQSFPAEGAVLRALVQQGRRSWIHRWVSAPTLGDLN